MARQSVEERFWSKVDKSGDCWEWTASKQNCGYGQFRLNENMCGAHRVAYELIKGPIPEGMEIDHLCRNRGCVNPLHLEAVTRKENYKRGAGPGGDLFEPKTHCLNGHPRTPENVGKQGHCKICQRELRNARYRDDEEYRINKLEQQNARYRDDEEYRINKLERDRKRRNTEEYRKKERERYKRKKAQKN